jgi:SAM-dependent methyltransferase
MYVTRSTAGHPEEHAVRNVVKRLLTPTGPMSPIVKLYLGTRRLVDKYFLDRALIRLFGGVHPKNVFNYRYEFFEDNVGPDDVVVDVGCGTGLILSQIRDRIKAGCGLDRDPRLPEYWQRFPRGSHLRCVQGDFLTFDFAAFRREFAYNVCIVSHVLEHIDDVPSFLRRIDADRLLVCVPSQENWRTQLLMALGLPYFTDSTHRREYSRAMLTEELERAGYAVGWIGFNGEGEITCRAERTR